VRRVPLVATLALAYEIVRGRETTQEPVRRRLLLEIRAVERRGRPETTRGWRAELWARDWAATNRPELLTQWRAVSSEDERAPHQALINAAYRNSTGSADSIVG
jgi:hypothetical protein